MRLPEHREEKQLSSHTARKGQSQNLNPKGLAPEPYSKCWWPRQEWRETGAKLTQGPVEKWWDRKSESHSLTKSSRVEFDPSSNITRVCWELGHKREIKLGFHLLFVPSKDRSSADPFVLLSASVTGAVLCFVTHACPAPCDPTNCSPPGSSVHGDSPGQNTGMGRYVLLQEIFPTQGPNPDLPHCRGILYCLSYRGSPRILEWVAYPFSRGSSRPRTVPGDCRPLR